MADYEVWCVVMVVECIRCQQTFFYKMGENEANVANYEELQGFVFLMSDPVCVLD